MVIAIQYSRVNFRKVLKFQPFFFQSHYSVSERIRTTVIETQLIFTTLAVNFPALKCSVTIKNFIVKNASWYLPYLQLQPMAMCIYNVSRVTIVK